MVWDGISHSGKKNLVVLADQVFKGTCTLHSSNHLHQRVHIVFQHDSVLPTLSQNCRRNVAATLKSCSNFVSFKPSIC